MRKFTPTLLALFFINHIFSQPVITSLTPASGPIGSTVTIKGNGFNVVSSNNIVYFGAVKANVTDATDSTITTLVPAGANYQPVSVTVNSLTAYSSNSFIVTFSGGSGSYNVNSFLTAGTVNSGMYPHAISLGDFNLDGKADVLVARGSSGNVSVFPNQSSGDNIGFGTKIDLAAAGNSHECGAIADFDGDGKLDFVVTNTWGTSSISVFRNTSSGAAISFAPKVDFAVDNAPYSVAAGDLDGDGKPDLAIANTGSDKITVYKNNSTPGNISFTARIDHFAGTSPYSVAIGDLNADGKPDLAVVTQSSTTSLSVMKNVSTTANILFDAPVNYATLAGGFVVAIGDLDGDGKPDLAAANSNVNTVLTLRNLGSGGSMSFGGQQNFGTGNYPVCVSIADFDGDGKPDLVTSNRFSDNISVLKNNSSPGNINFQTHFDYAVGDDPYFVVSGDLNNDSRPDIIAANSAETFSSVYRNFIGGNSPTIFSFSPTSGVNGTVVNITGNNFTGATSVKFGGVPATAFTVDSASHITATVGTGASGDVTVTTTNGIATAPGFTYTAPTISSFTPTIGVNGTIVTITGTNFTGTTEVKFGSILATSFVVNSSTSISATVGNGASGSVSVTTANGTASLAGFSYGVPTITLVNPTSGPVGSTVTITGTNFNTTASANHVFFGSVKANVTSATATQLTVIAPAGAAYQPISVTTNNLTCYSAMPFTITFPNDSLTITTNSFASVGNFSSGTYPFGVTACDLNDDGKPDLLTVNSVSNNFSVLKNTSVTGSISFDLKQDFSSGPDAKRMAIGDLDGDKKPDVVVVNCNSGNASNMSVFRNTSSGSAISFAPKADYATGNGTIGVHINDLNGDGKPDIVVASGNSGFISVFLNTTASPGTITFASKIDFTIFGHADNIVTADLDNDGKAEIITSNFSSTSISIFKNLSTGGNFLLAPHISYSAGSFPGFVSTGDLNNDGKLDIVVSNYSVNSISIFKNVSSFGNIALESPEIVAFSATNVSLSSLNGDNKPDFSTGRIGNGKISVLENTYPGTGSFSFGANVDFTTGNFDSYTGTCDLDGDGKPEIIAANTLFNNVTILKNIANDPVIDSLSLLTANSGMNITISGSRLTGAMEVKFGGTPAASFNVVSATKIEAVVGGGASGNVTVVTPSGTALFGGFNFIPTITAAGPTTFCNEQFVILKSSAITNNQWYKDGAVIGGATDTTFSASASGVYTVKTTSNSITTTSSNSITVTVTTVPVPTITLNAGALMSSAATGNQWYLNGTIIPGATNQTYQPTQNGLYTVKATASGCTSNASVAYNYLLTGIINLGNGQYIKTYPNPVLKDLVVSWKINGVPSLNINVSDISGRKVLNKSNIADGDIIDLSRLASGTYFLKIYDKNLKINETIKLIKAL